MSAIQDIFRQYAPAYLARFADAVPAQHRKVIEAICQCRTDVFGSVCNQCDHHHVLPTGFMKIRYYGLLSPNAKLPIDALKPKVELAHGFTVTVADIELPPWPQPLCPACGGRLRFLRALRAYPDDTPRPMGAGPPAMAACPATA